MKNLICISLVITGCNIDRPPGPSQLPDDIRLEAIRQIRDTDLEMSRKTGIEGFQKTLLAFADDSIIKPEQGRYPVIGKKALESYWQGKEDFRNLSWKPFRCDAALSGDMGYTIGDWNLVTPDTTYHGNYITIWKKQPDGKWKWVVDGGNDTPAPR